MENKTIHLVHLIGLGAIGASYASQLYKLDKHCVKVIVDDERLDRYKQGTIVNGINYNFDLTIPKTGDPKAELILISVKGHHLQKAIEQIAPLVGENTTILSLLNGITSEDDLSAAFGREKVLHGFTVGTDALREDGMISFKCPGKIVFNEYYPEAAGRAAPVAKLFSEAGINFTNPKDIRREMWWKFMMNVGLNQTSAILRASYGVYQTIPDAKELSAFVSREVLALAKKEGIDLYESDISEYLEIVNTISPSGKTSMLQDVDAGRKTEVESFALAVINLGRKHNIPTPINETIYRMIRVIESQG